MTSHRIGDFARDPNWIRFGKSLHHAVQAPSSYGFTSSERLIAEVARVRGVDPASLRNPLAAVFWMQANAPEALERENSRLAMTGVLLLSQISILDRELAEEITPKFFSGGISRKELKTALQALRAKPGGGKIAAHDRFKRAAAFEKRVFDYLESQPDALGLGDRITLRQGSRDATAPYDFAAIRDGEIVAAIEVKSHRQKRHHRYLVETLAMISLAARKYDRAFLIVPEDWGDAIGKIGELIASLRLEGVQHAVFSEKDTAHLKVFSPSPRVTAAGKKDLKKFATDTDEERHGIQPGKSEERALNDRGHKQAYDDAAEGKKLAAANFDIEDNRIVEVDPSQVHSAGVEDRMDGGLQDIDALVASIQAVGQKIPILVRPHPVRSGEYEIVAGRRRLEACRIAGRPVRAEIQDLDEQDLVVGQAIENIAREDLTYIERARLAVRMIDEVGLPQSAIDDAFCCGKTDRSRYLKIGRNVPSDVLSWIGKAPSIGRPRWEKLVRLLTSDKEAESRMRMCMTTLTDKATGLSSDQRFAELWKAAGHSPALGEPHEAAENLVSLEGFDEPVARLKRSSEGLEITLFAKTREGLVDWVEVNQNMLIEQIIRLHENKT